MDTRTGAKKRSSSKGTEISDAPGKCLAELDYHYARKPEWKDWRRGVISAERINIEGGEEAWTLIAKLISSLHLEGNGAQALENEYRRALIGTSLGVVATMLRRWYEAELEVGPIHGLRQQPTPDQLKRLAVAEQRFTELIDLCARLSDADENALWRKVPSKKHISIQSAILEAIFATDPPRGGKPATQGEFQAYLIGKPIGAVAAEVLRWRVGQCGFDKDGRDRGFDQQYDRRYRPSPELLSSAAGFEFSFRSDLRRSVKRAKRMLARGVRIEQHVLRQRQLWEWVSFPQIAKWREQGQHLDKWQIDLSESVLNEEFGSGPHSRVRFVSPECIWRGSDRRRLTRSKLMEFIDLHGSEIVWKHILKYCWLSRADTLRWFELQNLTPPLVLARSNADEVTARLAADQRQSAAAAIEKREWEAAQQQLEAFEGANVADIAKAHPDWLVRYKAAVGAMVQSSKPVKKKKMATKRNAATEIYRKLVQADLPIEQFLKTPDCELRLILFRFVGETPEDKKWPKCGGDRTTWKDARRAFEAECRQESRPKSGGS